MKLTTRAPRKLDNPRQPAPKTGTFYVSIVISGHSCNRDDFSGSQILMLHIPRRRRCRGSLTREWRYQSPPPSRKRI